MEETIIEDVKGLIVKVVNGDENLITPEANLKDDLGFDSLDRVELFLDIESHFSIIIPDDQMENLNTIGELIMFINENVK
jgi:acyl carrier protein